MSSASQVELNQDNSITSRKVTSKKTLFKYCKSFTRILTDSIYLKRYTLSGIQHSKISE